ncbi:MAG TPA: class I SAM-dependent methyltransferase [Pseudomonadales bacterium]|nr:class I SAM-dependent methyltransferase [Pseudomonadales bacterium]
MNCRHCGALLDLNLVDLGSSPPSNAYLAPESLDAVELWFPLRVRVCTSCWLAQTLDFAGREQFFNDDYAYQSSMSRSWLEHCRTHVETMSERLGLGGDSMVVEVAANDGYLLQYVAERGIPCYGVEPTDSTAAIARERGIDIVPEFFGDALAAQLASERGHADLMVANNVLAHVPDINDFVRGFATLLAPTGVATFEFPHLLRLIRGEQFDTIYHEHYSYLSLAAVERVFAQNGLELFDVDVLGTHGGSLRLHAARAGSGRTASAGLIAAREEERLAGVETAEFYGSLQGSAERIKHELLRFLLDAKQAGRRVAAYGAAAKGNTLLNFAGVRPDLLEFVCDAAPSKQGRFLPGSRIPVLGPEALEANPPDQLLILPWNIADEVCTQLAHLKSRGVEFVVAVPDVRILP